MGRSGFHVGASSSDIAVGATLIGLLALGLSIIDLGAFHKDAPELCINPPSGNPNACHIYTWNKIPQDTSFNPKSGMFNNDTSYYFNVNNTVATPGASFEICAQIISPSIGNATLTLQYWTGSIWTDYDGGPLGTGGLGGGSLGLQQSGASFPLVECSSINLSPPTIGYWSVANALCVTFQQGDMNGCTMRIAGNEPITNCSCPSDSAKFTELSVIFFYGTLSNPITCVIQTKSATQFVDACSRIFSTGIGPGVALSWSATNETTTTDGVWKFGTVTCSIPINGLTCTNTVIFSPAFKAGSTVTISFSQNPIVSGGLLALQTTYNILT